MSDAPDVTVLIPTYNRARFLPEAIDSVLTQSGASVSYEIVVVDDGSTDDTATVLGAYAETIRSIRIEHSGSPAKARNVGIAEARGELIAFLDSDDVWAPDKLRRQLPAFTDPAVVFSYGQAQKIYGDDTTPRGDLVDPATLHGGEDFHSLLEANVISTLTAVARRTALVDVGGFDESPELRGVEDYELWLRLAARFPGGIVAVDEPIALYRVHADGLGSKDSLAALTRLLAVHDSVWRCDFLTNEQRLALEDRLLEIHEHWSRQAILDGIVPAISVVMSVYRDGAFASEAIQSILDQTFSDLELIVVDDGSDEETYDTVARFADPRIRFVRGTNHGLVDALNKGLQLARAPLIARQDADDVSLPNRLEREYAWLAANPTCDLVGTFFRYVDERTLEPSGITITSVTKHLDIARNLYFDNPIGHGTVLARRSTIERVGGYRDSYGPNEDYDLWRRIVAAGGQVALLPDVYYLYRLNSSGISSTTQELQHRLFSELVDDIWRGPVQFKSVWQIVRDDRYYKHLDSPFRKVVHGQYKIHQIRLAREFLRRGHVRSGRHTLLGAVLIAPRLVAVERLGPVRTWIAVLTRRPRWFVAGVLRRARRLSRSR